MTLANFTKWTAQRFLTRFLCHRLVSTSEKNIETNEIKRSVFISESHDIFTNLALEDWIYRNYNFKNHNILMLWCNNPCIVIGRHQNPWMEANLNNLHSNDKCIQFARRNSGGGTVYHDRGNLNVTFFCARNQYSRRLNLEILVSAIFKHYGVLINITPRDDLFIDDCKVSGTASRLGNNAYHHCTLLVEVDKEALSRALQKQNIEIDTNATKSIRSKTLNLREINRKISINGLISAIGLEYLQIPAITRIESVQNVFQRIIPTEESFPGILELRNNLADWEWCYGKTPEFKVKKLFPIPDHLLLNREQNNTVFTITLTVDKGRVSDIILNMPPGLSNTGYSGEVKVINNIKGQKFTEDVLNTFDWDIGELEYGLTGDKSGFITKCVRTMIS